MPEPLACAQARETLEAAFNQSDAAVLLNAYRDFEKTIAPHLEADVQQALNKAVVGRSVAQEEV